MFHTNISPVVYGMNNRLITLGQMKGTPDSVLCLASSLLLFAGLPYGHQDNTNGDLESSRVTTGFLGISEGHSSPGTGELCAS